MMFNFKSILIFITILGMEVSWLHALLIAANKSAVDRLSIPLLLLTLLISFGVSRAFRLLRWPQPATTALSWLVWPVVMLSMLKIQLFPDTGLGDGVWLASIPQAFSRIFTHFEPALLVLLSTAALWWLGRRLAYIKAGFSSAVTEFQFGLILLTLTFFTSYELNLDQSGSLPTALAFFSLALIGISLSHAQDNNSWLTSWRQGHWSGMLLASIGIILLVGFVISLIVTPDLLHLCLRALGWLWGQIERLLDFFASLLPKPSPYTPPPMTEVPGGSSQDTNGFSLPEWLRSGGRLAWAIVFGGFMLFAFWRIASQIFGWARRRTTDTGGERESLRGAFWQGWLNWLKRIVSWIFGIKFRSLNRAKPPSLPPEIASVRQLYRQLLRWAAENGHPRQKAQTPNEYRSGLSETLVEGREELEFITNEYNLARYGSRMPTEEELNQLKQKWHNLKKACWYGAKKPGTP
jgi:hypothetical protein